MLDKEQKKWKDFGLDLVLDVFKDPNGPENNKVL